MPHTGLPAGYLAAVFGGAAAATRTTLAAISPDKTSHGYNLTSAFPMLMFTIGAVALYLRFHSPQRVLGQAALASTAKAAGRDGGRRAGPADGDTTDGSTLHEGTAQEGTAQGSTMQHFAEEAA